MTKVIAKCANPDQMVLSVYAEMTIAEWKHVLAITKEARYYLPLDDFRSAIRDAINAIQESAVKTYEASS